MKARLQKTIEEGNLKMDRFSLNIQKNGLLNLHLSCLHKVWQGSGIKILPRISNKHTVP
jgi:hypothetical protein